MWGGNLKSLVQHLYHLWQTLETSLVDHSSLEALTARVWVVEEEVVAMPRTKQSKRVLEVGTIIAGIENSNNSTRIERQKKL